VAQPAPGRNPEDHLLDERDRVAQRPLPSAPGTGTVDVPSGPRAIRARGQFPTEQAALKCLYLATGSPDPTGNGKARWAIRWKPAVNAFAITFAGRIVSSTTN
jgi:hypothetical protein